MKKINIFLGVLLFPIVLSGQSTNQNYIVTTIPTEQVNDLTVLNNTNSNTTIQYFDGLGRPIQTVQKGIGPGTDRKDIITYTEYDGAGRENIQWLPVPKTGNNGAYVDLVAYKTEAANQYGSSEKPYSTIVYESSPLNRVIEQFGAGKEWYDNINPKRNTIAYEANTSTDAVAFFYVNANGNLVRGTNYAQATLYKTISKDEDGKTVEEYKDKLGQVVLKRSKDGGQNVDTYFVNNDLGQQAYVIPPLAADGLTATGVIYDNNDLLKKYGYLYKYDTRGNCKEKRLPGCEPIFMVYDRADRLVLSQDGNQRLTDQWTVTKYDALGRLLYTGVLTDATTHEDLIADLEDELITEKWNTANDLMDIGYTCGRFVPTNLLTVNYYDNYNFVPLTDNKLDYDSNKEQEYGTKYPSDKGLLTGSRIYSLNEPTTFTANSMYYDYKGQIIQTRSTNHLGGFDITYNQYNFSGQVTQSLKEHSTSETINSPLTELYTHDYDHAGRLLITKYKLNQNLDVILNDMNETGAYDEIGRLKKKRRHSINNGAFQDSEEFDYNIRNWATRLKSGTFEEKLFYNTNLPSLATPCYNGNIAYSSWTYNGSKYAYIYKYDNLNRLIKADGYKIIGTSGFSNYGYNELFTYDKHGNILNLQRKKGTTYIDWINPGYNGNQMTFANDYYFSQNQPSVKEYHNFNTSGNDCSYDANGNMTKDLDRKIYTIRYNVLNLPEIVQFKDGHQIINAYDAGGQKLSSRYYTVMMPTEVPLSTLQPGEVLSLQYNMDIIDETGTFYVDNKEYSFNGCDPGVYMIDKVYNSEGYANNIAGYYGPNYQYYRKDHLGNNREVWRANTNQTIQKIQYYPSGLPWVKNSGDDIELLINANTRKYNGKEFVEMHGYDMSDLGFRGLQHSTMRFTSMDALAELTPGISPYAFCFNNPVRYIDPLGLAGEDTGNKDMFGRNRYDSFSGMYIPPIGRPGGAGAYGYGNSSFGHWETNSKTYYHQNFIYNSQDELVYYGNVQGQTIWKSTFIWDSQEEKQYALPRMGGGSNVRLPQGNTVLRQKIYEFTHPKVGFKYYYDTKNKKGNSDFSVVVDIETKKPISAGNSLFSLSVNGGISVSVTPFVSLGYDGLN